MNNEQLAKASDVLALAAEYDDRFQGLDPQATRQKIQAWAYQIAETNLTGQELAEGVRRAYSMPDRPFNPIGAILAEGKEARRLAHRGDSVRELTAGSESKAGVHGEPILEAYEHNNAIKIRCLHCGAPAMEFCADDERDRKIPHTKRLADAYARTHEGAKRLADREAHLKRHRATYKPKWRNYPQT